MIRRRPVRTASTIHAVGSQFVTPQRGCSVVCTRRWRAFGYHPPPRQRCSRSRASMTTTSTGRLMMSPRSPSGSRVSGSARYACSTQASSSTSKSPMCLFSSISTRGFAPQSRSWILQAGSTSASCAWVGSASVDRSARLSESQFASGFRVRSGSRTHRGSPTNRVGPSGERPRRYHERSARSV